MNDITPKLQRYEIDLGYRKCQMARIYALEAERQALYADYHEGDYRSADRLLLAARLSAELAAAWDLERRHRAGTRLGVEMYP